MALILSPPVLAGPYGEPGVAELVKIDNAPTPNQLEVVLEQSSDAGTIIRYDLGSFYREPIEVSGETYYYITLENEGNRLQAGQPALPHINRSIIIPDDARMDIRVIASKYVDLTDMPVLPSKGNLLRTVNPADVPYSFGPAYSASAFFPEQLAALGEPYILRDYRGAVIEINPFQYNPMNKTLRVYTSITVEVTNAGPGQVNVLQRDKSAIGLVPDFDQIYSRHFINYSTAADKYTPVGETGDMLIITYDAFATDMQPLVDWKRQKGIKTTMVNVSSVGNNATSIDNFIQAFYDSTNLAFVLLVGDAAQVASAYASGGESDPSYAKVAGGDNYPDILIGRFSAESAANVQTQVERTVNYEQNNLPTGWFDKGTGIGSGEGPGHFGEYDYEHIGNIRTDLLNYNYTAVDEFYASATASQVTTALNAGRGVINYCGHGSATSWVTTGFSNTNVNALANDNMLPFIFSVACVNGDFGGSTCFAEAWLRATHNGQASGALATYMSSINQSWNPPMDAQDEIADLLIAETRMTFGALAFNGSCKMIDINGSGGVEMYDTWHVFGDPSVPVRTRTADVLAVTHANVILIGTTDFAVEVAGTPAALCALTLDGVIYGTAYADAGGIATIPFIEELPIGNDLILTVTSPNAEPYSAPVTVITPDGPYCLFDSYETNESAGNGNGVVDAGESFLMGIQLKNVGPDDAINVDAVIATTDTFVTITDNSEYYGTITGNDGLGFVADGFAFALDPATPDKHNVVFTLTVNGTNRDTWEGTFTVKAHAPDVQYALVTINDAAGNSNGILDPGETADFVVTLSNFGSGEALNIAAVLSESDSYTSVLDDYGYFGAIDSITGATANSGDVYTVAADASCPMGYTVTFNLVLTGDNGYTVTLPFDIVVGDRVTFFTDDFSFDQGWTGLGGSAEWMIGAATGGSGADSYGGPDPAADHTPTADNGVLGNDITSGSGGDYAGSIGSTQWVTSPPIDCSDYTGVQMTYVHWLGVEAPNYDYAAFQVYNGTSWVTLFENTATTDEQAWVESFYDLSAYADENPDFKVRFGLGPTDGSWNYCGWNIDDIQLKGYDQSGEGDPLLSFMNTTVADSMLGGETAQQTVRVYNTGTGNLRIRFNPMVAWLTCSTDQNYVAPNDSLDFVFTVNSAGLAPGDHTGMLHFTSNDYLNQTGDITVNLHLYTPGLSFAQTELADSLVSGDSSDVSLRIYNTGIGNLHISFTSGVAWLHCLSGEQLVGPTDSLDLPLTFTCGGLNPGDYAGALQYTSDDPTNATGSVPLSLHIYAPVCNIPSSSIEASMAPGDTGIVPLVISNNGPGRLSYSIGCQAFDNPKSDRPTIVAAVSTEEPLGYRLSGDDKGDAAAPFFAATGKSHGGPDLFGYSWIDSDDPGGPAFSWIDITATGTPVTLGDDASAGPIDLGFTFPYYDQQYTQVYIGSNGFLTFTAGSGAHTNLAMPNTAVPNALLALWWDDLNPSGTAKVYHYYDAAGGRFIVSFVDVPNYLYPNGTGSLSFQAILYPNGKITMQYGTMDPGTDVEGLTGATVGIENADGTDGLQVTYNAAYMHSNLAIDFGVVRWLWVSPGGGLVEPYSSATVDVHFDARDLEAGSYSGQLSIATNDPLMPAMTLPVSLALQSFVCGDVDADGDGPVVSDLTYLVGYLFQSGPTPAVLAAADCDGQGGDTINVADLTYLVTYLFQGGAAPVCH